MASGVKFPTVSSSKGLGSGDYDYDVTGIVTKTHGNTSYDLNLGYTFQGDEEDPTIINSLHYGVAVRHAINDRFTLVDELFADKAKGNNTQYQISGGFQYVVKDNLILDAAIGTGLGDINDVKIFKIGLTRPF